MAKTTYTLSEFDPTAARSGALCVMVKKKKETSTTTTNNVITRDGGEPAPATEEVSDETLKEISNETLIDNKWEPTEGFGGAGVCRVSNDSFLFTVDSVTYTFNSKGQALSKNAIGYELKIAGVKSDVTSQGSIANANSTTTTLITRDALGNIDKQEVQYVDDGESHKVIIDTLEPRDQFAMQAMRAIMGHITDPSILSKNEINHYCDAAYQWAANMMQAAANVRDVQTYGEEDSGVINVGVLDTKTEMLLSNIDNALRRTDATEEQHPYTTVEEAESDGWKWNPAVSPETEEGEETPAYWSKTGYLNVEGLHDDEAASGLPKYIYAENVKINGAVQIGNEGIGRDAEHPIFVKVEGGGGGGSTVSITPILSTGTAIATFSINTTPGTLYAPASLPLSGGVLTGDLSFNKELTQTNPSVGIDFNTDNSISITKFGNDTVLRIVGKDKVALGVGSTNVAESESINGNLYLKVPGLIHDGIPDDIEGVPIDKDDYVVLGGGGYKPLSEIGGGIALHAPIDDINAAQLTYPQAAGKYILQYDTDWGWSYAIDGIGGYAVPRDTPNNNVVPVFNESTSKWEYRAWSSGGGGYTPGDGIDITNDEISVKYDGTTIKRNTTTGELYAVGGGGITEAEMWTALGTNTTDKIIDSSHLPTPTLPSNLVTTDTSQVISGSKTFTGSETFTGSGVRITYDTQTILPISSISETRKNIGTTAEPEYEYSLTVNGGSNLNLSVSNTNVLTSKNTGIENIKVQGDNEMPFKKECITYDSLRELLDKLEPVIDGKIAAKYDEEDKIYKYNIARPFSPTDNLGYFYYKGELQLPGGTVQEERGGIIYTHTYPATTVVNPIIEIIKDNNILKVFAVDYESEDLVARTSCLCYNETTGVFFDSTVRFEGLEGTTCPYMKNITEPIAMSCLGTDYYPQSESASSVGDLDTIAVKGYIIPPTTNQ